MDDVNHHPHGAPIGAPSPPNISPNTVPSLPAVAVNENGGLYENGKQYALPKKMLVARTYVHLCQALSPRKPSINDVARLTQVGKTYAGKVIDEIEYQGGLKIPHNPQLFRDDDRHIGMKLAPDESYFLLSLRAENPARPNFDYCKQLQEYSGTVVSPSFISTFFLKGFDHKGSFRRPNTVPIDKFKEANVLKYLEFQAMTRIFGDHTKWCFIDEKHLVNKDVLPNKIRADPETGRVEAIPVSADFREAYNLIAVISPNPTKKVPVEYSIGKFNGTAANFVAFIEYLLSRNFFERGEILVLDNAAIHSGAEAGIVTDLLWTYQLDDGQPLQVYCCFLPAQSPELNPIELVFHILSRRVRSYRNVKPGPVDHAVVRLCTEVLNDMTLYLIKK